MIFEPLSGFPMSDIGYPIELDRRTALDKLYITQLLPTRYSINIMNTFGGYQYNKQWMYVYEADFQLNIHLMYTGIRRITNWIFIWCINGSGRLLTEYLFSVCRTPLDYWLDIHSAYGIGQADCWLNIHSVYAGIRWITDRIFSRCMNGSGGLLTKYSFGVCRGQVDYWLDVHSAYGIGQADFWPNIHLVYAGI